MSEPASFVLQGYIAPDGSAWSDWGILDIDMIPVVKQARLSNFRLTKTVF